MAQEQLPFSRAPTRLELRYVADCAVQTSLLRVSKLLIKIVHMQVTASKSKEIVQSQAIGDQASKDSTKGKAISIAYSLMSTYANDMNSAIVF